MEENQHGGIDLNSMVMKFEKRRFDGGSEIELIEYIERSNCNNPAQMAAQYAAATNIMQDTERQHAQKQEQQARSLTTSVRQMNRPKAGRSKQVLEALIIGPMELAVGSVGILTSGLAIMTFSQMGNPEMAAQSKVVLKECANTLVKGFFDTLFAPIIAIKVAVVGT